MTPPERYPRRPLQSVDIENSELSEQEKHKFIYVDLTVEVSLEQIETIDKL